MTLLGKSEGELFGTSLTESVPEFAKLFDLALSRPSGSAEGQVEMTADGRDKNLFLRITTERSDDAEHGYVLTFDDMTDLSLALRSALSEAICPLSTVLLSLSLIHI